MSRAFVGDDQYDSSDDEAPELKVPIPTGSRNYLTPEGARRLADELRELETGGRPKLAAEIERLGKAGAANSADALSNARRALGRIDRRIEYLSRMASIAETVEPPGNGYDRVKFGAAVTIVDSDGSEHGYRIVGVDEADPERGLLGWTSPLARAMMGRKPGDSSTAILPGGERRFRIKSVR